MKARPDPTPNPDAVSTMWDHGDRLDTLERKRRSSSLFVREHTFVIAEEGGE